MISRQVIEGTQIQGKNEKIGYSITATPWASTPANVVVAVADLTAAGVDVTSTVMSGSSSVNGDVITLPLIQSLTAGHTYRVTVRFTAVGNTFEAWFDVSAEN